MEHRCEKCGVLFKGSSWRIAQSRHMARKNPCDRPNETKYIRETKPIHQVVVRNTLGCMDIPCIVPPSNGFMCQVVPHILKEVFSLEQNMCIVWPNLHKEELVIFINEGLKHVSLNELTVLITIMVHNQIFPLIKKWSRYEEFKDWIWRTTLVDLDNDRWTGDMSMKCEYFQCIRKFIKEYFGRYTSKRKALRNLYLASGFMKHTDTLVLPGDVFVGSGNTTRND